MLEPLRRGRRNKEIADAMHVTENTVEFHVRHLLSKFGARSRLEVVRRARQRAGARLSRLRRTAARLADRARPPKQAPACSADAGARQGGARWRCVAATGSPGEMMSDLPRESVARPPGALSSLMAIGGRCAGRARRGGSDATPPG